MTPLWSGSSPTGRHDRRPPGPDRRAAPCRLSPHVARREGRHPGRPRNRPTSAHRFADGLTAPSWQSYPPSPYRSPSRVRSGAWSAWRCAAASPLRRRPRSEWRLHRPRRDCDRERPGTHRAAEVRGGTGRTTARGDAGRPGSAAGGSVRCGHRGGRASVGFRLHRNEPVQRGRHRHSPRRVDEDRRSPANGDRRTLRPRRSERNHARRPDGSAGAGRRLRRELRERGPMPPGSGGFARASAYRSLSRTSRGAW